MSNILIIKHGSLGDLIQANGAMEDIKASHKNSKVLLLTSQPYLTLMSRCPYIDGVIVDKRLPRWNLFFLLNLRKLLKRYNFTKVYDLQNSNRTKFYKNYLLNDVNWSSSETILLKGEKKSDFDNFPVLERFSKQLEKSGVKTNSVKKSNLAWALTDIKKKLNQITTGEYILVFPFCSKKHQNKKWPFYKELIEKLKIEYSNRYSVIIAPGPNEKDLCKEFNAKLFLNDNEPANLNELISLIQKSKFIISNDTGPAHICAHLNKKGLVLFGGHTSAKKVSIESDNFKSMTVKDLNNLKVDKVFNEIKINLN